MGQIIDVLLSAFVLQYMLPFESIYIDPAMRLAVTLHGIVSSLSSLSVIDTRN